MDAKEKKIIEKLSKQLRKVSKPPFESGDLKAWSSWANTMQTTIRIVAPILEGLTEVAEEENKIQTEEDFLSKNSGA